MNTWLHDLLPILDVEHDSILSKQGDVTIAFELKLPEIFTLSNDDYESFHHTWIKALKILPNQTVFHKQDWFTESKHQAHFSMEDGSFLTRSSERFFNERPFLDHSCFLFLTRKPVNRKSSSSALSSLLRKSIVPAGNLNVLVRQEFVEIAGQFKSIMESSGFVQFRRLGNDEIHSVKRKAGVIERYCYLLEDNKLAIRDISFKGGIRVGNQLCQLFTLSNPWDLSPLCGSRINYDRYSTDKTKFSVGFASTLGQLLPCNHIYNQYLFTEDTHKAIRRLEGKKLRLQSLAAYSRENAIARDAVNEFLNEAVTDGRTPIRAHFNILVWTDKEGEQKDIRNLVSSALAQMDAVPKQEMDGAPQIHWAGIPGNEADFPMNDTFETFAEQASCFFNLESCYRSSLSPFGIRLGDRLTGKPVHVDISDEPVKKGIITNRNKFILGPSGSGKSFFTNHMVGAIMSKERMWFWWMWVIPTRDSVIWSRATISRILKTNPIRFNPFYIGDGDGWILKKRKVLKPCCWLYGKKTMKLLTGLNMWPFQCASTAIMKSWSPKKHLSLF